MLRLRQTGNELCLREAFFLYVSLSIRAGKNAPDFAAACCVSSRAWIGGDRGGAGEQICTRPHREYEEAPPFFLDCSPAFASKLLGTERLCPHDCTCSAPTGGIFGAGPLGGGSVQRQSRGGTPPPR